MQPRLLRASRSALPVVVVAVLTACGSSQPPGKYPPRKPGCEIQIFPENPSYQTDNIGVVNASCAETVSDEECLRTLKDEACKLGADTVWGVPTTPTMEYGKKHLSGRAAHQK